MATRDDILRYFESKYSGGGAPTPPSPGPVREPFSQPEEVFRLSDTEQTADQLRRLLADPEATPGQRDMWGQSLSQLEDEINQVRALAGQEPLPRSAGTPPAAWSPERSPRPDQTQILQYFEQKYQPTGTVDVPLLPGPWAGMPGARPEPPAAAPAPQAPAPPAPAAAPGISRYWRTGEPRPYVETPELARMAGVLPPEEAEANRAAIAHQQEQDALIQQELRADPEYQEWARKAPLSLAERRALAAGVGPVPPAIMERARAKAAEKWKATHPYGTIAGLPFMESPKELGEHAVAGAWGFTFPGAEPPPAVERMMPLGPARTVVGEAAHLGGGIAGMTAIQTGARVAGAVAGAPAAFAQAAQAGTPGGLAMTLGSAAGRAIIGKQALKAGEEAGQAILGQEMAATLGPEAMHALGMMREIARRSAIEQGKTAVEAEVIANEAYASAIGDILRDRLAAGGTPEQLEVIQQAMRVAQAAKTEAIKRVAGLRYPAGRHLAEPAIAGLGFGALEAGAEVAKGQMRPEDIPAHLANSAFGFMLIHLGFRGVSLLLRKMGIVPEPFLDRVKSGEPLSLAEQRVMDEIVMRYRADQELQRAQEVAATEAQATATEAAAAAAAPPPAGPPPAEEAAPAAPPPPAPAEIQARLAAARDQLRQRLLSEATTLERKRYEKFVREGRPADAVLEEIQARIMREARQREAEARELEEPPTMPPPGQPPAPPEPLRPGEPAHVTAARQRDFEFANKVGEVDVPSPTAGEPSKKMDFLEAVEELTAQGYTARQIGSMFADKVGRHDNPIRLIESVRERLGVPSLAEPREWMRFRAERAPKVKGPPRGPTAVPEPTAPAEAPIGALEPAKKAELVGSLKTFFGPQPEPPPPAVPRPEPSLATETPEARERRFFREVKSAEQAIAHKATELGRRVLTQERREEFLGASLADKIKMVEELDRRKYPEEGAAGERPTVEQIALRMTEYLAEPGAAPAKARVAPEAEADKRKAPEAGEKRLQTFLDTLAPKDRDIIGRGPYKSANMRELLGEERFKALTKKFPGRLFRDDAEMTADLAAKHLTDEGVETTEREVIDTFLKLLERPAKQPGKIASEFGAKPVDPDLGTNRMLGPADLTAGDQVLSWNGQGYEVLSASAEGARLKRQDGKVIELEPWDLIPMLSRSGPGAGKKKLGLVAERAAPEGVVAMAEDPWGSLPQEVKAQLIQLGGHYMFQGVRDLEALTKAIVQDVGTGARPYVPALHRLLSKMPAFAEPAQPGVPSVPKEPPDVGRPGGVPPTGERGREAPRGGAPPAEPRRAPERPAPPAPGPEARPERPAPGVRPEAKPPAGGFAAEGREIREGGVATLSRHLLPDLGTSWPTETWFPKAEVERLTKLFDGRKPLPHQTENVVRALKAFYDNYSFLIGDGTGTGKTMTAAMLIDKLFQLQNDPTYARMLSGHPEPRIVWVVFNEGMVKQAMDDVLTPLGFKKNVYRHDRGFQRGKRMINFMTYKRVEELRRFKQMGRFEAFKPDLLIFDESQALKNWDDGTGRAIAGEEMSRLAKNTVFMSATPVESVIHTGYLTTLRMWWPDRIWTQWMFQKLGIRYDEAKARWEGLSPAKLKQFYEEAIKTGRMVKSEIDFHNIKNKEGKPLSLFSQNFLVKLSAEQETRQADISRTFQELLQEPRIARSKMGRKLVQGIFHMVRRALDEEMKTDEAMRLGDQAIKEGKSVIYMFFRKAETDFDKMYDEYLEGKRQYAQWSLMPEILEFLRARGVKVESALKRLENHHLKDKVVRITGDEPAGSFLRNRSIEAFMSGHAKVAVVTMAAGGTGLSLHDMLGNFPRLQINLTAPYTAMDMQQVAGRSFRLGSQSNGELFWFFADTAFERSLARKVSARLKSMGALVRGQEETPTAQEIDEFEFPESGLERVVQPGEAKLPEPVAAPAPEITITTKPGPMGTIYVEGQTFRIREALRKLGGTYSGAEQRWLIPRDKVAEAERLIAEAKAGRVPEEKPPQGPVAMGEQGELPGGGAVRSMADRIMERVRELKKRELATKLGDRPVEWEEGELFGPKQPELPKEPERPLETARAGIETEFERAIGELKGIDDTELLRNLKAQIAEIEADPGLSRRNKDYQIGRLQDAIAKLERTGQALALKYPDIPAAQRGPTGLIGMDRPMTPGTVAAVRSRKAIIRDLEKSLDTVVRGGWFDLPRRVKAYFTPMKNVIRARFPYDVRTIAHEMGHRLDGLIFGKPGRLGAAQDPNIQAYRNELMNIASTPLAGGESLSEGFAEYIRLYITEPDLAQKYAPSFSAYFDKWIHETPDLKKLALALDAARSDYQLYKSGTPEARAWSTFEAPSAPGGRLPVAGFASTRESLRYMKGRMLRGLREAVFDDFYAVRRAAQKLAEMRGRPLDDAENMDLLSSVLMGRWGKAQYMLERGVLRYGEHATIDTKGNLITRALQKTLGMKVPEGEAGYGEPLFKIIEELGDDLWLYEIYAKSADALQMQKDRGWDPFERVGIDAEDAEFIVNKYKERMAPYHKRFLRYGDALLQYLVDAGMMTQQMKTEIRAGLPSYHPLFRIMDDEHGFAGPGTSRRMVAMFSPIHRRKGSQRPTIMGAEGYMRMTFQIIDRAEKNAVAAALVKVASSTPEAGKMFAEVVRDQRIPVVVTPREIDEMLRQRGINPEEIPAHIRAKTVTLFRAAFHQPPRPYTWVWLDGKRQYVWMHPEIYDAFQRLDQQDGGVVMGIFNSAVQSLRAGAVRYFPPFWLTSALRDVPVGWIQSEHGLKYLGNLVPALYEALGKGPLYWKIQAAGGAMAAQINMTPAELHRALKNRLRASSVSNFYKHPGLALSTTLRAIAHFGEALEAMPRIAEVMARGQQKGVTRGEMVRMAHTYRESTQDFLRLGYLTRFVTGVSAFFGPAVGGYERMYRAVKDNPVRTLLKLATGPVLASIALWYYNRAYRYDDWKNVRQDIRDNFWVFFVPGVKNAIRWPKPYGYGILASAVERMWERFADEDPEAVDQFGRGLLGQLPNPTPTLLLPLLEVWLNKSLYTGRPIMPEWVDPEERYRYYTSETAKFVGKQTGVPPAAIEHVARGWTGGLSEEVFKGSDWMARVAAGAGAAPPEVEAGPEELFIAGRMFVREPVLESEATRRFYDVFKDAEMAMKTWTNKKKEGMAAALAYRGRESERIRMYHRLRPVAERLAALREQWYRTQRGQLDPEAKRKELMDLTRRMTEVSWRALRMAGRAPASQQSQPSQQAPP